MENVIQAYFRFLELALDINLTIDARNIIRNQIVNMYMTNNLYAIQSVNYSVNFVLPQLLYADPVSLNNWRMLNQPLILASLRNSWDPMSRILLELYDRKNVSKQEFDQASQQPNPNTQEVENNQFNNSNSDFPQENDEEIAKQFIDNFIKNGKSDAEKMGQLTPAQIDIVIRKLKEGGADQLSSKSNQIADYYKEGTEKFELKWPLSKLTPELFNTLDRKTQFFVLFEQWNERELQAKEKLNGAELDQAESIYKECIERAEQLDVDELISKSYDGMITIAQMRGDRQTERYWLEKVTAFRKEHQASQGMDEDQARYEIARAGLDLEDGKLPDAEARIDALIKEIQMPKTPPIKYQLVSALLLRSTILRLSNRYLDAFGALDEAEMLAKQLPQILKKGHLFSVYLYKAKILSSPLAGTTQNTEAALNYLEKARQTGELPWAADEMTSNIAFQKGDWEQAAKYAKQAYEAISKEGFAQGVATLRIRRGISLLELGLFKEAEAELNDALIYFNRHPAPDMLALAQFAMAKLYLSQKKHGWAWIFSSKALDNIEPLIGEFREITSQQQFLIDKIKYYDQAFTIALIQDQNGLEHAWSVAEQAKSFHLSQLLANSNISLFEGLSPEKSTQLKNLEIELDECQHRLSAVDPRDIPKKKKMEIELETASKKRQQLLSQLMIQNKRWAAVKRPSHFNIREVIDRLEGSWGLISYYWIEMKAQGASLSIFYTDKNNQIKHKITQWTQKELSDLESYKHGLYNAPDFLPDPNLPKSLGQKIFPKEIQDDLENKSSFLVSPHGRLRGIPLHLITIDSETYLFERWKIQYIPSFALIPLRRQEPKQESVLLVACPEVVGKSKLDEAEIEIKELEDIWTLKRSEKVYSFSIASNSSLADMGFEEKNWSNYDILHFSCHGEFPPQDPFDAGLLLGKDRLRASEIFTIKLNASMVSLSACCLGQTAETISGKRVVSDEWVGLFLPLFYAGAKTILVSLWEANSEDAVEFMKDFHKALSKNEDPHTAFQQALKSAKDRAPEMLWGNWYLVGFPPLSEDKV